MGSSPTSGSTESRAQGRATSLGTRATGWSDSSTLDYTVAAQQVEHPALTRKKAGSSPAGGTMNKIEEAQQAFLDFHASCFWSYPRGMRIEKKDVKWVAEQLRKHGNREAGKVADSLLE